jgi:hypothetical protein
MGELKEKPVAEELPPVDIESLLKQKGYSAEEIRSLVKKDILFFSSKELRSDLGKLELLTTEMVEIKKILKSELEQLEVELPLDKQKGHRYQELLGAEIDLGIIIFLSVTAWEIAKGIISNWLYDRFRGMRKESKKLNAKLEIQVTNPKNGRIYHFKYSGPADKIAEIIKEMEF